MLTPPPLTTKSKRNKSIGGVDNIIAQIIDR